MHTTLPFFAVVRVSGDDRHSFLHNQLSNDINHLPFNHACYATYNSPKGRVIANMLVYHAGDSLLLAMAADLAESVVKRLRMFVLRAKVQIDILPDWGVAATLPEHAAPRYPDTPQLQFAADTDGNIALPHGGLVRIAAALPEYSAAGESAWQIHEIRSGYPWISAATAESSVAQMLNQHTIGGVHFRKGCYPGQEVIARAQYRGQVKRGLAAVRNAAPLNAGDSISAADGSEAGTVINSSGSWSLLVIKHSAAQQLLQDGSGSVLAVEHLFFDAAKDE